jgi:hypothetical protein
MPSTQIDSDNDKMVPSDQTDEQPQQGETKKVDTEAQEDAAEDRANSGGYQ